jgi:D-proline reductase (dithiol) PrdB
MTDDAVLREMMSGVPVPTFEDPAWVTPPPLAEATVAIVTTAGLHHEDQEQWELRDPERAEDGSIQSGFWRADESFRVLDGDRRDFRLAHWSPNFDRTGFAADLNVVFPVDRLNELAREGVFKAVAPRHLAFIGAQDATLSTIRHDTGPAAAKLLREQGVDIALLFPVCPVCSRTVGTLSHVLEANGIATAGVSLVRGQTERLRPPRALYCEFPLGRPLGKPSDAVFQTKVLRRLLGLFGRPEGPILEDYPEVIEATASDSLSCTLPPRFDPDLPAAVDEAQGLRSAYERQLAATGRSSVGRAIGPAQVPDAVAAFVRIAEGVPIEDAGLPGNPTDCALDVRAYYEEAALALSDHVPVARHAENWYYRETETGRLMMTLREQFKEQGADKDLWFYMAPLTQS